MSEELMERKMTTESHRRDNKGSQRDHNEGKGKEDGKTNGIRKQLTDAEYEKELAEIRNQFNKLKLMIEETQRIGWFKKMRVKWKRLQQKREQQTNMQLAKNMRKLEHRMNVQLGCTELRVAELEKEVCICEAEEEIIDDFLNYWPSPDQLDDVKPCIFESNNCDVITGFAKEDEKSFETVGSMGEYLSEDK